MLLAKETLAARDDKRDHDSLSHFEFLVARAHLNDLSHEFMTQHISRFHRRNRMIVEVQIGSANRGGRDLDDGVPGVDYLRIRNRLHADIMFTVPSQCAHGMIPTPSMRRS